MGVVERISHGGHDVADQRTGHAAAILLVEQSTRVGAFDVVHVDPQPTLGLAPVVHTDDVWMPQGCRDVRLAVEPLAVFTVGRHRG